MVIKLNIKSIVKFEQLTNKSFNQIEFSNEDDLTKLLYCIVLTNNPEKHTYETFKELLQTKKLGKEIVDKFNTIINIMEQFTKESKITSTVLEHDNNQVQYIRDIVGMLVVDGNVSIDYMMNEMEIYELPIYLNAYNDKVKQQMENNRLWTYLSILPHIDSKKLDEPKKLIQFPWEMVKEKETSVNNIKCNEEELNDFLKNGFEMLDKIKLSGKIKIKN